MSEIPKNREKSLFERPPTVDPAIYDPAFDSAPAHDAEDDIMLPPDHVAADQASVSVPEVEEKPVEVETVKGVSGAKWALARAALESGINKEALFREWGAEDPAMLGLDDATWDEVNAEWERRSGESNVQGEELRRALAASIVEVQKLMTEQPDLFTGDLVEPTAAAEPETIPDFEMPQDTLVNFAKALNFDDAFIKKVRQKVGLTGLLGLIKFNKTKIQPLKERFNKVTARIEKAKAAILAARAENYSFENDEELFELISAEIGFIHQYNWRLAPDPLLEALADPGEREGLAIELDKDIKLLEDGLAFRYERVANRYSKIDGRPTHVPDEDEPAVTPPKRKIGKRGIAALFGAVALAAGAGLEIHHVHHERDVAQARQARIEKFNLELDPSAEYYTDRTGQFKGVFEFVGKTGELKFIPAKGHVAYLPENADPANGWLNDAAHDLATAEGWVPDPKHPGFSLDDKLDATVLTLSDRAIRVPVEPNLPMQVKKYNSPGWSNVTPADLKVYTERMLGVKAGEIHDQRGDYTVTVQDDSVVNFKVTAKNKKNNARAVWNMRIDDWEKIK